MSTTELDASSGPFVAGVVSATLVGAAVFGYGLLLVPASVLGGVWVASIGLSLVLSALFATERVGDRLGLSAADRRTLSLSFAVLAVVLLVAFVVVNFASVEPGVTETSG
ncbi:hypothetical protein SAMN04488063_0772 [Halopelagius inordinatus]|uniref:Uncharacterized protein n=1 Tax=Halopelagius inordinatus TaxID=553467 RepID=A0A1I2MKD7_9EURY|nr:hypothetical protein [Halopelagius inordinatus]SFF91380.1 hypothetical protein SAMN04488063_0772 [Halopelagius inordinatus]